MCLGCAVHYFITWKLLQLLSRIRNIFYMFQYVSSDVAKPEESRHLLSHTVNLPRVHRNPVFQASLWPVSIQPPQAHQCTAVDVKGRSAPAPLFRCQRDDFIHGAQKWEAETPGSLWLLHSWFDFHGVGFQVLVKSSVKKKKFVKQTFCSPKWNQGRAFRDVSH